MQEALGARLLPIMAKITNFATGFINGLMDGSAAAGGFGQTVTGVFGRVKEVVGTVIGFLAGQLAKTPRRPEQRARSDPEHRDRVP